jgi:putative membrane protein
LKPEEPEGRKFAMRRYWQSSALLAAMLGLALPAAAQTSGGGGGGTGTSSTSPGVTPRGESETGVGIPGDAPADNRTLQPVRPKRDLSETGPSASGTGAGAEDIPQESMEGHLGHKAPGRNIRNGLAALHAANQSEIEAGRMAEQSASSPEVKAFAKKMVEDHSKNDEQLVSMAGSRVDLSSNAMQDKQKEASASMKDFQGKTGTSFDQAYMAAMVKDHRNDAADVKTLASRAHREGAKDWAAFLDDTEKTMQSHLSDAERIRSSIQNTASSDSSSTGSSDTGNSDTGSSDTGSSDTDASGKSQ